MVQRIRTRPLIAYALSTVLSTCAFATESWLWHSGADRDLFVLSYGAILLSAWLGGLGPGLLATTISSLLTAALLMSPAESVAAGLDDVLRVGVFVLVALLTSSLLNSERRAQEQVAAALRERRELMSSIAHDLRSPLAVIQGNAQIVQRLMEASSSRQEDPSAHRVLAIERAARQISSQVDELLDTARLEDGQTLDLNPAPVNLVDVVERLVLTLTDGAREHAIAFDTAEPELIGDWDAARITRVLDNLLTNALKYSPSGAEVRVVVTRVDEWAVVEVSDQGIGIPAQDVPHIFERFHRGQNVGRAAAAGSGVGLASARHIVEQHGGRITVRSEEGAGSTFCVYLPLSKCSTEGAQAPEAQCEEVCA